VAVEQNKDVVGHGERSGGQVTIIVSFSAGAGMRAPASRPAADQGLFR